LLTDPRRSARDKHCLALKKLLRPVHPRILRQDYPVNVRALLPGTLRAAEVDLHIRRHVESLCLAISARNPALVCGSDLNQSEVAITVPTPCRIFARDPECRTRRTGLSGENYYIVISTTGSVETVERISQTTTFAHITKVVSEIMGWLEADGFSNWVGRQTAWRNPAALEEN